MLLPLPQTSRVVTCMNILEKSGDSKEFVGRELLCHVIRIVMMCWVVFGFFFTTSVMHKILGVCPAVHLHV